MPKPYCLRQRAGRMEEKTAWSLRIRRSRGRFLYVMLGALFLVSPIFCSCTTIGDKAKGSEENLVKSTEAFNTALRWGDYKTASCWISNTRKESYWQLTEDMHDKLRIMDFEVRDVFVDGTGTTGTAIVLYKYYYTHSPCLQNKTVSLRWTHEEQSKVWQLDTAPLLALMP